MKNSAHLFTSKHPQLNEIILDNLPYLDQLLLRFVSNDVLRKGSETWTLLGEDARLVEDVVVVVVGVVVSEHWDLARLTVGSGKHFVS